MTTNGCGPRECDLEYGRDKERAACCERELMEAEAALWRIFPNTHTIGGTPDPFEGPGETFAAAYWRLQAREKELLEANNIEVGKRRRAELALSKIPFEKAEGFALRCPLVILEGLQACKEIMKGPPV